ncbi:unnamed protein product [Rotaria socialis]|uniref:Calpain catalytic domain-containing protein n=1 Tax=Rotaria socialis TaxID=392032 RepID=A0A821BQQ9_9BILA|nr:unnamed protein product [Rotaria socialis]CAF3763483.1 unnamed protein product [Rotaria socialis]CAF4393528.1 unnamed protein product [Rotaria socialis]CAF4594295.1 unnamed protein product [Rotaria socialis]
MGTTVSQYPSHKISPEVDTKWNCPACSADSPNSAYPICMECGENYLNFVDSQSKVPSTKSWQCDLCSFNNHADLPYCTNCNRNQIAQNERELHSAKTSRLSSMRPKSVAVRDRRTMDASTAEKLSRDVIAFCKKNKMPFVDDGFLPSDQSLGALGMKREMQWLPLAKIAPSTDLDDNGPWTIYNSPEPSDIHQGELGDCWLLAALALITERPDMLQHILLTKTVNPEGVYVVRICHHGIWKAVLLDQYFPCTQYNTLAYSRAARRQLYVPLIEKACAKIFGSYANLSGGSTAEGLQLLTGAPTDRISLHPIDDVVDFDIVWAKLLSACESKLLIGASTGCSDINEHEYALVGLNSNHAFTVLLAKSLDVGEGRFLLLRDPHGTTNFSEDSITPKIRKHLSSIRVEMPNFSGIFWITWSSFLRFFESITISTYVSNHFDIREQAQFTESPTELLPAYYFTLSKTSLITVSLIYHRHHRKGNSQHTQSFVLCNVEEETSDVGTKEVILESHRGTLTYWNGSLRPGAYVIIPFSVSLWKTRNSKKDERTRNYTLVIHSSIPVDGGFLHEPPTFLADCLIAATLKYCNKPLISNSSVVYTTPRRFAANLIVVENQCMYEYLTFNMIMTNADNIYHSRHTNGTIDCVPPRHRQLICILEWGHLRGEVAHMSYATSQRISRTWHNASPTVAISQADLHSPRPF